MKLFLALALSLVTINARACELDKEYDIEVWHNPSFNMILAQLRIKSINGFYRINFTRLLHPSSDQKLYVTQKTFKKAHPGRCLPKLSPHEKLTIKLLFIQNVSRYEYENKIGLYDKSSLK